MKETIYTIPINEAYEQNCECPLCFIEKKLERERIEYELGPAMMEPDHREESNSKGYCNKHYSMLFNSSNKLPLALILDTHIGEIRKKTEKIHSINKRNFLSKKTEKNPITQILDSCMVCEKIEQTMNRYCKVLVDMWSGDSEFREKFNNSKGFCLPHFSQLYNCTTNIKFIEALLEKELKELEILQSDIHKFTLKFDYRNKDMEWGSAKDAPIRATEKIGGYLFSEEI